MRLVERAGQIREKGIFGPSIRAILVKENDWKYIAMTGYSKQYMSQDNYIVTARFDTPTINAGTHFAYDLVISSPDWETEVRILPKKSSN